MITGADPGFFVRRGCTRPLLYFNTNKQNTSCIRKPQVISGGGGGVRTPSTHPQDPSLDNFEISDGKRTYLEITISGRISSKDFCGSSFTGKSPSTGMI